MEKQQITFDMMPQVVAVINEKINDLDIKLSQLVNSIQIKSQSEKSILTRREAKELLGVSYVTLNRWEKEGVLPAQRMGSKVMYLIDDVHLALRGRGK